MLNNNTSILVFVYFTICCSIVIASESEYREDHLLVRFSPKASGNQRSTIEKNEILSSLGIGTIKREYRIVHGLSLVKLSEGQKVQDAIKTLAETSCILYAEPDYKIKLFSTFPNDTNFPQFYGLHNIGQRHPLEGGGNSSGTHRADIDAPQAWRITTDASEIIVAVIDSGIDYNHPDLAANMWVNEIELNGISGVDDDNNGYVDDIRGWDFADNENNPIDYSFHGTHIAGIIGSVGNNSIGVMGVCWNVKIMNLKIFPDYEEEGFNSDAISAIQYAVEKGAKVLNNSWGRQGGLFPELDVLLKAAIESANEAGVLFIASSGNTIFSIEPNAWPIYPASFDCENMISVLATNHDDEKWFYSSYGPISVDLGAPGENILSTFPTFVTPAMTIPNPDYSTYYETISGTSMAAPYVAGACALVWSMDPSLGHLQVKDIILNTVDVIPALENHPNYGRLCLTGGRLNLYNAILEASVDEQIITVADDVNDGNSVLPDDTIYYTISCSNPVTDPCDPDLTNVTVVDFLPDEVAFMGSQQDCNYNEAQRTVTFNIGTLSPGESNSVTVRVRVGQNAEPLGTITNLCALGANEIHPVVAAGITDVNVWSPVIYVDSDASRLCNGMTWNNAYIDLQDALSRARMGCASEIWVAGGTYKPSKVFVSEDANFSIVNGVSMFGGFAGNETQLIQRNLANPNNKSILTAGTDMTIFNIVRADNLNMQTIVDGFQIENALTAGLL